jgi:hypothetical protein
MWDPDSGEKLRTFRGHKGKVLSCDWSPDSQCVVSVADDGFVIIWNPKNTKQLMVLKGVHEATLCLVKWSHDGRFVATADINGIICIWDLSSATCVRVLKGHSGKVTSIVWSQDENKLLISAGQDGAVYLWQNNILDPKASLSTIRESRALTGFSEEQRATAHSLKPEESNVTSIEEDDVIVVENHAPKSAMYAEDIKQSAILEVTISPKESLILEEVPVGPVLMSSIFDLSESLPKGAAIEEQKTEESYKVEASQLQAEIDRMDVEYKVSTNYMQNLVQQSEDFANKLTERNRELDDMKNRFKVLQDTLQTLFIAFCKVILGIFAAKVLHDFRYYFWSSFLTYPILSVVYYVIVKFVGLEDIQDKIVQVVFPKLKKSPQPALIAFAVFWTQTGDYGGFLSLRLITDALIIGSVLFRVKGIANLWQIIWK